MRAAAAAKGRAQEAEQLGVLEGDLARCVAWLGEQTPGSEGWAATWERAERCAVELARFVHGTDAAADLVRAAAGGVTRR